MLYNTVDFKNKGAYVSENEAKETENIETELVQEDEPENISVGDEQLELIQLEDKLKAAEEKYIRVHAEFENIKKRLEREKYQAIEYASEKFAKDLIPVLDSLGMAIESSKNMDDSADEHFEKLSEGVELTQKQFLTVLEKHGITKIDTDCEFDPNVHEAVMRTDDEEKQTGEIVQTLQVGYRYKERTLRAAMVSVAN